MNDSNDRRAGDLSVSEENKALLEAMMGAMAADPTGGFDDWAEVARAELRMDGIGQVKGAVTVLSAHHGADDVGHLLALALRAKGIDRLDLELVSLMSEPQQRRAVADRVIDGSNGAQVAEGLKIPLNVVMDHLNALKDLLGLDRATKFAALRMLLWHHRYPPSDD